MGNHTSARQSPPDDASRRVLDDLRRIVQALRFNARTVERQVGLSGAQLFVLSKLADGQSLSINALAERTATHQSSVSVVVSKLVAAKMLARSRSQRDGRVVVVSITPRGRAALSAAPASAQDALLAGLAAMSARDRSRLSTLLGRWRRAAIGTSIQDAADRHDVPSMFFESTNASSTRSRSNARRRRTTPDVRTVSA